MTALGLIALVLVLLVLRQNVMVIVAAGVAYAWLIIGDGDIAPLFLDAWDGLNREVLLSVPLYVLAGNIMSKGEIADRLVALMRALTAPIPGGLAIATVLSCALFAAISGSGTVTLLAVGAVMYPALLQAGYSRGFSLGALCAAGTLGIVIPPSIPLILYGVMTRTNIADLFIGGIGPGLMLIALMAVYSLLANRHIPATAIDWPDVRTSVRRGFWALLMPVIILGGIYSGHFTATESAAVAVVYALIVETLIHRQLGLRELFDVTADTAKLLGSLFPILMFALGLNMFLAFEQIPERLVGSLSGVIETRAGFLLLTNALLLVVGCVMDIGSAILILAPILQPVAAAQGIDPIHFGIIMVVNLEIGYLTPPLGLNLIVAMTAFREDFSVIVKGVAPFLVLMLIGLALVTFWPTLSTFAL